MYNVNTSKVLNFLGYTTSSYNFTKHRNDYNLIWYHTDPKPTEQDILDNLLPTMQQVSIVKVKTAASNQRLKYVTAGKDKIYDLKLESAAKWKADGTVDLWLQAEINGAGLTADQVVAIWDAKNTAWQAIGAAIEEAELTATRLINDETVADQCDVIAQTYIDQIEAI